MRFNKNRQPLSTIGRKWRKSWSGREDSNLRPLPPENAAPDRTDANASSGIAYSRTKAQMFAIRPVSRFMANLGALFTLPFRALRSLPLLVGFLLVGWPYLRDVRKGKGR